MGSQRAVVLVFPLIVALALLSPAESASADDTLRIDVHAFHVVTRSSGPVNYYSVNDDPVLPFIHAAYTSPLATVVLGYQVPDSERTRAKKLHWTWRAITLPAGGDECASGKEDSAAVVYVTWKRTLRWYTLKYVWSSVGTKGRTCDKKRNAFVAQDTVILESGPANGTGSSAWKSEEIDLAAQFRAHFEDGDPTASVPDFGGVGIMSDGDQTKSASSADYADFSLTH